MKFIQLEDMSWINLKVVIRAFVYKDAAKYKEGSEDDQYRWKVAVETQKGTHDWESFGSEFMAREFLDMFMQEQINGCLN